MERMDWNPFMYYTTNFGIVGTEVNKPKENFTK